MKECGSEPDVGEAAQALHDAVLDRKAAGKPMVYLLGPVHPCRHLNLGPHERSDMLNSANTAVVA